MLLTAGLLLAVSCAFQSDDEPPPLRWDSTLENALVAAKAETSIVFAAFPNDFDGEGNGSILGNPWTSVALRRAVSKGRALVASSHKHVEYESGTDRDGKPLERYCSRFGLLLCEQHREIEKKLLARYFDGADPGVRPMFLVLDGSTGTILARRLGDAPSSELAEMVSVAQSILKGGGEPVLPSELIGRAMGTDAAARARALRLLASFEFPAADASRRKLLSEAPDDKRREEILLAIAEIGGRGSRAEVLREIESKSLAVRIAAARALGAAGLADAVEPLAKAWARAREDEEKKWILRSLGRCARSSEVGREILRKAMTDLRVVVRANACIAMRDVGTGDATLLKVLRQRLESDAEARVRGAAIFALATMEGADPKELIPYLRQRKPKEKDPKVSELLSAAVAYLDGAIDTDLSWVYPAFAGDPVR